MYYINKKTLKMLSPCFTTQNTLLYDRFKFSLFYKAGRFGGKCQQCFTKAVSTLRILWKGITVPIYYKQKKLYRCYPSFIRKNAEKQKQICKTSSSGNQIAD